LEAGTMTLGVDRKTAQLSAETRRLWDDGRVWFVNCVAVESGWPPGTRAEREQTRRGCDRMLAALIEVW
jgi:hypothetical protein